MLHEAKEDLPDGIYIHFRTDGSLFNLWRLLAHTKTIEELISELLFADNCALLTHMEEALQHIIICFPDVAKNFGHTNCLKKTEVLYQSPPRKAHSPLHISTDDTNLKAVEHFTFLDRLTSKRVWQSHSLRLSTKIQVHRVVVVPKLLYDAEIWVLCTKQIRLLERFH